MTTLRQAREQHKREKAEEARRRATKKAQLEGSIARWVNGGKVMSTHSSCLPVWTASAAGAWATGHHPSAAASPFVTSMEPCSGRSSSSSLDFKASVPSLPTSVCFHVLPVLFTASSLSRRLAERLESELEKLVVRRPPLGQDRHYRRYWWGLGGLKVGGRWAAAALLHASY